MINDLKQIVLNEMKVILNEISIKDKYDKEIKIGKTNLPFDIYQCLCNLDPTTKPNQVGKYANWIIAKYDEKVDLNTLKRCLEWYVDGVRRNIVSQLGISNDINSFKSYEEFISIINSIKQNDDSKLSNSEYNNRQKLEGQFNILGSTSFYDIIEPLTYKAERYFGSNTEWCTVANEEYFDDYMGDGELYIIYPKNGDSEMKMQFHFESSSFADKYDNVKDEPLNCINSVIKDKIIYDDLVNLCKKVWFEHENLFITFEEKMLLAKQYLSKGEIPRDIFSYVGYYYNGLCSVRIYRKWNFIDTNYHLLSDQWFDFASDFNNGFSRVKLNYRYNFINTEGKYLSDQWFDLASDFNNGFARVELNDRYNFINTEGKLVSDQWFDFASDFNNGFSRVGLFGKGYNFINTEGKLVSDQWFDLASDFNNGFARVKLNDRYNFINTEGKYLSDQWFDFASDFNNGFSRVELGYSSYKLDTNGVLYDIWGKVVKILRNESVKHIYLTNKQINLLNESIGLVENYQYEYAKDDVDLSSFEKQNELNQDIWDSEDKLNSRVRLKLLDIADDFIETIGISWIKPIDIIITGSLCNYNWSSYSDVDLHIVIDFSEISDKTEIVQEYFNLKKNEWNEQHTNLTIFGFNVELYIENIDNDSVRGGIYSLEKDKWIKKPSSKNISKISSSKEEKIKYFASYFLTKIEYIEDEFNGPLDDVILRKLSNKCDKLIKTLQTIRKNGLKEKGEMSVGNIIYKICRRTNYLDKLYDLKNKIYDKINSLD
jgi:hypothetical protein